MGFERALTSMAQTPTTTTEDGVGMAESCSETAERETETAEGVGEGEAKREERESCWTRDWEWWEGCQREGRAEPLGESADMVMQGGLGSYKSKVEGGW